MPRLVWALFFCSAIEAGQSPPTFNKDIAPLVYQRCAPCHHDGGIGPFALTSFDQVRRHASQIVDVTGRRYMPPWPPQPGYGDFKGDRHLSDEQIRLFADWVQAGKLEGSADPAPAPKFPEQWQMGKPDLILGMPQPFTLPASGPDLFRNFVVPNTLRETRYIRGFELRLNTKRAVHHANVVLDRNQSLRHRDGEDGQPGFPGMDVITEAAPNDFEPDSHFLFWKPATALTPEPDDLSWRLDSGTDLILNLHLQPTGKLESVSAEIGLYFAATPPTKFPMLIQLEHDGAIRIPPGNSTFSVVDELTLPVDVDVLAIYPHAHYLGKVIEAHATVPDGSVKPLIRIPDWDINWQATYEYRKPIFLPAGSRVSMRISYDNSPANPRNPNHPPKLVTTGDRSQDEMGHVWLQVLPRVGSRGKSARWALQEAIMRRRLEKYPGDFLAEYNLGAFLQSQGRLDDALGSYRKAIAAKPGNATAHNSAGAVLLLESRLPEAISELQAALEADGNYQNARFNLGRALAASGDLAGARDQYTAYLRLSPDDAAAQAAQGIICFRLKDFTAALDHLREAVRLAPGDADTQANLGTVLALQGDLPAAIRAFEAALKLNPNQEAARRNLERARAALAKR